MHAAAALAAAARLLPVVVVFWFLKSLVMMILSVKWESIISDSPISALRSNSSQMLTFKWIFCIFWEIIEFKLEHFPKYAGNSLEKKAINLKVDIWLDGGIIN